MSFERKIVPCMVLASAYLISLAFSVLQFTIWCGIEPFHGAFSGTDSVQFTTWCTLDLLTRVH